MKSEVVDEEKCQGKALNIVLQQTHLRGMSDADCCHIKWNCVKNAMAGVQLDLVALKLTIVCALALDILSCDDKRMVELEAC